jgi:hypothetical protein
MFCSWLFVLKFWLYSEFNRDYRPIINYIHYGEFLLYSKNCYNRTNNRLSNFVVFILSLNHICRSAGLEPSSNPSRDGSASHYLYGSDADNIVSNDMNGVDPFILASVEYERLQKNKN